MGYRGNKWQREERGGRDDEKRKAWRGIIGCKEETKEKVYKEKERKK